MIRTLLRVRVCAAALAAPLLLMGLMLGLTGCPQSSGSSLVCNPGEVPNGGVCVACPCGSYCDDGRRATACAAGSFNANTGSSSGTSAKAYARASKLQAPPSHCPTKNAAARV